MKELHKNWFSEGLMDFEYKKYILLAYLKEVDRSFTRNKLYPFLGDVIFHYQNVLEFLKDKEFMSNNFPKEVSKSDLKKMKLVYKKLFEDDEVLGEMHKISEYALPQLKKAIVVGTEIYEFAESKLEIEPIGLKPLYQNEGYVFTMVAPENKGNVYRYEIKLFEHGDDKMRSINLKFIKTFIWSLGNSFESMKLDLIKDFTELPNPATYLITSSLNFPFKQTFLPIAKRLLVKNLAV